MKLTPKESNNIRSRGLYIADKCDSCGKLLNQTIRYTRSDRKGCVYCSAECRDLACNGEGPPDAVSPYSIATCVVRELIADKIYGCCASCGLPLGNGVKAMRIPELPGLYHNIACAEQGIYERGCRFCGEKLTSKSHFCSERCASRDRAGYFGDGRRLIAWLAKHQPELVKSLEAGEEHPVADRKCAYCGGSLSDKRRDAKYCSDRCQKRDERQWASTGTRQRQTSQETPTVTLCLEGVTDTQNAQTVLLVG